MAFKTLLLALCLALLSIEAHGYKNYVAYKQANISYFGAWQTCRLYGGHLASIESADENARVVAAIKAAGNSAKEWYIGLTDMGIEGRFIWIGLNKELNSMSYNNWNTGEPNNVGNEDCTVIVSDAGTYWNDISCTKNVEGFVCAYVR